jgi:ferredoxin
MPMILCLPDHKEFEIAAGETILEAALRADILHAYACGGNAKCSTCRIWISTVAITAGHPANVNARCRNHWALTRRCAWRVRHRSRAT